ncbi:MAG: HDOD domain-containing protein [Eubacteriales bacterium]|nr:HDOD domain-containing protein [Eubacteriales bacterium]
MNVYVARQPIFDKNRTLYGYELLYRKSENNFYEGFDDDHSTASVLTNSFMVIGFNELTDDTRAFINFSQSFLEQGIPSILPKERVVVEILERVNLTDEVIAACRQLKEQGYILALDDFVIDAEDGGLTELIQFADIIKIEYPSIPLDVQERFIKKHGKKVLFLAERIETVEEFEQASALGYSLFQGYFFSKPVMVNGITIDSLNTALLHVIQELRQEEPNYEKIADIIQKDLGLSYKLLKISNSVIYGALYPIKSIKQALARFGTANLRQWTHLLLLQDIRTKENMELVKTSIIRGRMLSLLSEKTGMAQKEPDYFITGIFASLDSLLNDKMENIMKQLPLEEEVKQALLGEENEMRKALDSVLSYEKGSWEETDCFVKKHSLTEGLYTDLYFEALKWQRTFST